LIESLLVGLGSDLEGEVADGELGGAEEGIGFGSLQGVRHFAQFRFDELMEFGNEGLGNGLLIEMGCLRHGFLTENKGGFPKKRASPRILYTDSANFRDAHTVIWENLRKLIDSVRGCGKLPQNKFRAGSVAVEKRRFVRVTGAASSLPRTPPDRRL
jgi:hypothetical protein